MRTLIENLDFLFLVDADDTLLRRASVVVEATAPSIRDLPPRAPPETHRLRPFEGFGAGLW